MAFFARFKRPGVYLPGLMLAAGAGLTFAAWVLFENWLVALIVALSVLLIVLIVLVVRMLIGREREERLDRGLEAPGEMEARRAIESRSATRRGLQETFRDALAEIRNRLQAGVNELPWVLVLGATGSGKSSLLAESGLDLPAEYARSRVLGPTQNLEFYLANEAIMLDTPGRYLDGDESDSEEWETLLKLLRSARPDCPIDGVIFALPVPTLLSGTDEELWRLAHQLRRRLNELEDSLGELAPVYLVLTKSDVLEGFVETAERLSRNHVEGAFGWTNDQRDVVEESGVNRAFAQISERLDRFLPELILGEPDPERRRSLFLLPQELREVGYRVSRFLGEAFKPSVYMREKPFLRGVYLVSSHPEGATMSPSLQRLGHAWARTDHGGARSSGLFLRDLFLEIIVGDEGVAVPGSRLGPLGRRLVLGLGAGACLLAIAVWSFSFASNYQGTHRLETLARLMQSTDPPLGDFERMRVAIGEEAASVAGFANTVGFRRLGSVVGRARQNFVVAFGTHYDRPTKQRLAQAARRRDDRALEAIVVLAEDLAFLSNPEEASVPDFSGYTPLRVQDKPEAYAAAYGAYGLWLAEPDLLVLRREGQDVFDGVADQMLDVNRLETLTRSPSGSYPSVSYPQGLGARDEESERIPGMYTKAGFDGLVSLVLSRYESSPSASPGKLKRFRRTYAERFDRSWRRHFLEAPELARPYAEVKQSPYLTLIAQLEEHTAADVEREEGEPAWIEILREARAIISLDPETPAPWLEYMAALDTVAIDVENAQTLGPAAVSLARDVAEGQPNSFVDALQTVRKIVPRGGDAAASSKLRKLLELPVLNGFSAVGTAALAELDKSWNKNIAGPYGSTCDERCLQSLYGPGGEFDGFKETLLLSFFSEAGPTSLLEDRALPFGPEFLAWMENGANLQRRVPGGFIGNSVPVRVRAVPAQVTDLSGLRAKRVELRLDCPDGPQEFIYKSGDHAETFGWTPACDQLTLRVVLARLGETREHRLERAWHGPFALPDFLKAGTSAGGGRLGWDLRDGSLGVLVRYRIESGQELREMAHRRPPSSLGS